MYTQALSRHGPALACKKPLVLALAELAGGAWAYAQALPQHGPALARHVACTCSIRIRILLGILLLLIGVLKFGLAQTCASDDLLWARMYKTNRDQQQQEQLS